MHRPFTSEWAKAFCRAVNASGAYRAAAYGWTWPVTMVLEPAPEVGYAEAVGLRMALRDGACEGVDVGPPGTLVAPYVLRGSWDTWKALIRGELEPVTAVLRRRLALEGSIATVVQYSGAARELVACARAVPTVFPDEGERP